MKRRRASPADERITVNNAFQRLRQHVEPPHDACERLNMALRTGHVHLWADSQLVDPSFFVGHLYVAVRVTPDGRATAELDMTRAVDMPLEWSVSGADVESLRLQSTPGLSRRRPGPATTHDWFAICGEIARRCVDPKSKRVEVPGNESKLADNMLAWCQLEYGREPAPSEMRKAVQQICAALRRA